MVKDYYNSIFMMNIGALQPYLQPRNWVVHLGSDASFNCDDFICNCNYNAVEWLINGTALNTLQLNNVRGSYNRRYCFASLQFSNVPVEYNSTSIQCIVNTTCGLHLSENSTLLVQGIMSGGTYPWNRLSFLLRCGEKRGGLKDIA